MVLVTVHGAGEKKRHENSLAKCDEQDSGSRCWSARCLLLLDQPCGATVVLRIAGTESPAVW